MLDPIVSLSVALAEAPGACAFLLGSGVSGDAGVPTGREVMQDGLRKLYLLETSTSLPIEDEELDGWLEQTGRSGISYSALLELIAPDRAVRREYLAKFFEGKEPGPTHQQLADLAADGLVRVFVTTNFDRLLEHALQARGIDPVVIASDSDLESAMPREHASCVVLKPHGDYLQQTIRNTPEELAQLEPGITQELSEVFSRYGVVVVGYSGSDEALAETLRARRSRYGLWWVARTDLQGGAGEIVEATSGRMIKRDTAASFLVDLRQRLTVFEQHPSGITPAVVHDSVLRMLRDGDRIGLDEELRREQYVFEDATQSFIRESMSTTPNAETIGPAYSRFLPLVERRLASLLPLAIHDLAMFEAELAGLPRMLDGAPRLNGYTFWQDLPRWACTWAGYVCGALLARLDRWENVRPLLVLRWTDANGYEEDVINLAGEVSNALGQCLVEGRWIAPGWEHLWRSLSSIDWLGDRYPELCADGEPRRSMAQFDLLNAIAHGTSGRNSLAWFTLGDGGAQTLARRLHRDATLRARFAAVVGVEPNEFVAKAGEAIRASSGLGHGPHASPGEVADLLETGSGR
jgi:SIR2-like domain